MGFLDSLNGLFSEPQSAEDPAAVLAREASRHTLLLIDDDRDFLECSASMLRNAGYNVLKSTTGSKGLNMLRYAPGDITAVLLDYDMPELNGIDTLKFIRQIAPRVKVGGVSGVESELLPGDYTEQLEGFLAKPFEGDQLVQFVRDLVSPSPVAATADAN